MKSKHYKIKRRTFLKHTTGTLASLALMPSSAWARLRNEPIRTAFIGLGFMGVEDLKDTASHPRVQVAGLCEVDAKNLAAVRKKYPEAKAFKDYRKMLESMRNELEAVVVSTPDHTHAPASLMAMDMGLPVYCQKPLTHHVSESRQMAKMAREKDLVTQMGIQVHSFYDYKLATLLIQSGIIGKVHTVHAWSPKNWGYDGPVPTGSDPVPEHLDWNLWLGTAPERPYKKGLYHQTNWRKIMDFGCGTLGDMGVHIFDTPYNALQLDVPETITTQCREPNGYAFPENNTVTYTFPGTTYTADQLKWIWYDGKGAPANHEDLSLPDKDLPEQGAMFMGEKGKLLLPHFMQLPRLIVDGRYVDLGDEIQKYADQVGQREANYSVASKDHYHQFVDAILGEDECSAPFSYGARLTETILLGTIAGRFPNQTLHWDRTAAQFREKEANSFLSGEYRSF